jgi:hypothetical protein
MTSRQQIKAILAELKKLYNAAIAQAPIDIDTLPANMVSSWDAVADIIGQGAVTYIRTADTIKLASMAIHVILANGHNITTDGRSVYTSYPIEADRKELWLALRPALIRVIRRQA